jgi:hypothetical protein
VLIQNIGIAMSYAKILENRMKRFLPLCLISSLCSVTAFAGAPNVTQKSDRREECSLRAGNSDAITRTATYKMIQKPTKTHSFEVICSADLSYSEVLKSWYQIDTVSAGAAQVIWKPESKAQKVMNVKCRTNDPLILGIEYDYSVPQVPSEFKEFELSVLLEDGGPRQFAALPALVQRSIPVGNEDVLMNFITIQGNSTGEASMYLEFAAYPKALLNASGQSVAPHYTTSISPRNASAIPLEMQGLQTGCKGLRPSSPTKIWNADGQVSEANLPTP